MSKTGLVKEQIEAFVNEHGITGDLRIKFLSKGANSNIFQILSDESKYILTLLHDKLDVTTRHLIESGSNYFRHLGFPFPELICLSSLNDQDALLTSFVPGKVVTKWEESHYSLVGKLLASLHSSGEAFPKEHIKPPQILSLGCDFETIQDSIPKQFHLISNEIADLQSNWPTRLPSGLIHNDIWYKNILFGENEVSAILDFTMPTVDQFVLDLATLIKGIYFSSPSQNPNDDLNCLLTHYQMVRPLSSEELDSLEIMLRSKILYTILYLLKKSIKYPNLRENFLGLASFNMLKLEDAKYISFAKILA